VDSRDRGNATGANDLQRDFVNAADIRFAVDLANGTYDVTTHSGDWIGTSRTDFTIEGVASGQGNAGAASVTVVTHRNVVVTDGQLNIQATGSGPRLNAVEITPVSVSNVGNGREIERLDRGAVAVPHSSSGNLISWRLLADDPANVAFNVYRNGTKQNGAPITNSTNFHDPGGTPASSYEIRSLINGDETAVATGLRVWGTGYRSVKLQKPAGGTTPDGVSYTYSANDASVGDLDGDGTYEMIIMWSPSNAKDNAHSGYTGEVFLDAYKLDGKRLWRISLGKNIRAGAHYSPYMVYDLNGDGRAEVVLRTADGTKDGKGTVIGDGSKDYRNSNGYVLSGPEYLTLFDGLTGAIVSTINYVPARGTVSSWGDSYGNRVDRFLASVAYLDGKTPSVVFQRGYYTRTVVAAFDYKDGKLQQRWVFDSNNASGAAGNGNHQQSVADVDGDGRDEIILGSLVIDDNGQVLHNSGMGHGDALHVGDFDPDRPGQEIFMVHEDMGKSGNKGSSFRDGKTGQVLWTTPATADTGRGTTGDIDPRYAGAESWAQSSTRYLMSAQGQVISNTIPAANFMVWWDGDLLREIADHTYNSAIAAGTPTVSKWNWNTNRSDRLMTFTDTLTNNTTKGTPALQADLFGDWREELVYRSEDSSELRIYTTNIPTSHRLITLMQDPQYRVAVAWQNSGYNQPPHTSYVLGEGMSAPVVPSVKFTGGSGR
jgi:rhamnogalacturonan endolyase